MKKDNLERFVRDNREAFDDKEPPNSLWQKLEQELDKQQPERDMPFRQIHINSTQAGGESTTGQSPTRLASRQIGWPALDWRVAASIAVLLLAGVFMYMNHEYGVAHQPEVVAASPMYAKEVMHYTELIDVKRAELKQMTQDDPELYAEFATDLDRLEKSYQSLKSDLPKNPNQEVLIQAMIQNLQLQINLLNEQLRVIQRIKQQTHENPV
ncbi:hypothetical protein [Spirosoma linguale]|uniref:Anti-sigma factor n=1 Tax=Spirosoma linguale (strain ATCC 33905 / DSM 74 / LMG 10896 / Claus 1) TaxID=504472 RepID=D2QRY7_SPILD|nr:hypothetical protein Slin_5604 [Spirosoma linguale DSM 74]